MKFLNLEGLTHYTEKLLDKIKTMLNEKADKNHTHNFVATDTDTVDGYHASEFQKAMDFQGINTDVLEYAENYPTTNVNGTFFTCRIFNGYNEPNAAEGVVGSGDYYYCMHKIDNSWITILAIDVRSWNTYIINKHSGTWGVWRNISDGGNADTVDNVHAWQMQTLDTNGNSHGSNDWLMQVRHNLDGDGYFKIACGDGSVGTKVDLAHASNYASNAITATSSIYSNYLSGWSDTRHENTAPNDYNGKFYIKGLKINEAINSPDNSSFSSVLGFRSWADASGGQAHELAFTGNGQMFQRHGDTDTWSSWNRFYTSENIGYGTSELTAGVSPLATGNFYFQYE